MLLLHVLLPDEPWDYEPSIEVLQDLQKRTQKLPKFWKDLLSEMISLEPTQRIESAAELWKRLLPQGARNHFLFFPTPAYFQIPPGFLQAKQIINIQTASSLNISEIERIILQESWKDGAFTASFDFRNTIPEEVLRTLCRAHVSEQPPSDLFSAIECLQKASKLDRHTMILRYPESLNSSQRALLSYALTALQSMPSLRFVLLGNKQAIEVPEESASRVEIPTLTKHSLNEILPQAFPSDESQQLRQEKIRAQTYSLPDQVFADLRTQLPQELFLIWPAAARDLAPAAALESLKTTEMRILGCLAIASAPLSVEWIFQALKLSDSQGTEYTEDLQAKALIQTKNDCVSLAITPQTVLRSLRKDRVRGIAESLLKNAPKEADPGILYRVACESGNKRVAALHAIQIARKLPKRSDAANEWYLNAFLAGAQLPKSYLYRLVNFSLRTACHTKSKRILHSIRRRFGHSLCLASAWFDLYWRTGEYRSAEKIAQKIANSAGKTNRLLRARYFQVRQAGALIMQSKLHQASMILNGLQNLPDLESNEKLNGPFNHYSALACFFKGDLDKAVQFAQRSVTAKHSLRNTSFMNLGTYLGRLGLLDEAEKWLWKAVRIFQRRNDLGELSLALGNLGIVFKRKGKTREARVYYFRSLQLSQMYQNHNLTLACLTNLSASYEVEGRLKNALQFLTRAMRLARDLRLNRQVAFALTERGRLYSILGEYNRSVACLKEAIKIRQDLQALADLAISHELTGLTYLLSGHLLEALVHFSKASELFQKSAATLDHKRVALFTAMATNDLSLADETGKDLPKESLENGLYHYLIAALKSKLPSPDDSEIRDHLHESERVLRNVPSLFWLGRVLKLKTEYYLQKEHFEKARIAIESAYNIFTRLGARKELLNLNRVYMDMKDPSDLLNKMAERLPYRVLMMVKEVLSEQDPQRMISRILSTSIEFTDMERAVLILSENPPRIFKSATLDDTAVQEIYEISQSALEEAAQQQKPYISLNAVADSHLKSKPSIIANRIRSILCLPLRSAERTVGVLYLDSKEGIESIAKTESVLLEIFSNIISLVLEDAVDLEQSRTENEILKRSTSQDGHFSEMIGNSKGIREVREKINRLAIDDHTVLIVGKTGTGKEPVAKLLHDLSHRKDGQFIPVNCASITETLLESELFGHEKGAFTGADSCKKGLFELAQDGTLFLDEIADLPYALQPKFLRVLQEREFRRVGGNVLLHTNARVLLASNKDLIQLVKEKKFREDLYYRISGIQVFVPSLRTRKEDIALLASQFLKSSQARHKNKIRGFTRDAVHLMEEYSWPGNVRQLKNEIERITALSQSQWIEPQDFSKEIQDHSHTATASENDTLRDIEHRLILQRLNQFDWNIVHTAKSLGLTRHGLYNKMRTYDIKRIQPTAKKEKA